MCVQPIGRDTLRVTAEAGKKLAALLGRLFSPGSLLSTAYARGGNFQVTVVIYVVIYGNNRRNILALSKSWKFCQTDGGQGFTL